MPAHPHDVTGFWRAAGAKQWFAKSARLDAAITLKFEAVHMAAARGEHDDWGQTPEGSLALLILLDQFPRNLFRATAHAFATDPLARKIARAALDQGHDQATEAELRPFFYLPFEHSEELSDQTLAIELCRALRDDTGDERTLQFAELHHDIIVRFGRFPHRNKVLGRMTTEQEQMFLDDGGFAG